MATTLRTIPLIIEDDQDLRATIKAFGQLRRDLSETAFNGGKPLGAIPLHHLVYKKVKGRLSSQMTLSAFRSVAGAYQAAKSNGRPANEPFRFAKDMAVFLIGDRGRDAGFTKDGKLSIWTVAGRKRLVCAVPKKLRPTFDEAIRYASLTVREDRFGRLKADIILELEVPEVKPGRPIGVDRGETNALVAVDGDRQLFITGKQTRIRNKRTRKTISRLQRKLSAKKAVKGQTRSVRRLLKRLGRKRSNRTKDFCRCAAKQLVNWAGEGSTIVLEKLNFKVDKRRKKGPKALRRRLSEWPHALLGQAIRNRAELAGIGVVEVDPAYTSQICSSCGQLGNRRRHHFSCPTCGFTAHADVNAAVNIRQKFTVLVNDQCGGLSFDQPRSSAHKGKGK